MKNTRQPSIHVTEDSLAIVLGQELGFGKAKSKELAKALLVRAKKYTITNRKLLVNNAKVATKATKLSNSTDDATLFAQYLYLVRKNHKHRGISQITAGSKDWPMIKQIASQAKEFCKEFELPREKGFREYIELALTRVAKLTLPKLLYLQSALTELYEANLEIREDEYPELTRRAHDHYIAKLIEKTGFGTPIKEPMKLVCFKRVAEYCRELGIKPEIYIDAQFDSFAWRNVAPDPMQLAKDKAKENMNSYLFKNNITVQQSDKKPSQALQKFLSKRKVKW